MEPTQRDMGIAQENDIVHVNASFAPLIPKFIANRKKEIFTMRAALTAQDFAMVRKIAHGAKGAGGTYGFTAVTTMAAAIECAAKRCVANTIDEELRNLSSYLERVKVIFDEGPLDE